MLILHFIQYFGISQFEGWSKKLLEIFSKCEIEKDWDKYGIRGN